MFTNIKTFEDVLLANNITETEFEKLCNGLEADEIAYKKLKLISKALNEGWVPDWKNGNWDKWIPYFIMGGSSGSGFAFRDADSRNAVSNVGSRLCFKSEKVARYAGTQFEDLFREYFVIE